MSENENKYLTLICSRCTGQKLIDWNQEEGDLISAETSIECVASSDRKHHWTLELPCPECDKDFSFPVDEDGEPQQAMCFDCGDLYFQKTNPIKALFNRFLN